MESRPRSAVCEFDAVPELRSSTFDNAFSSLSLSAYRPIRLAICNRTTAIPILLTIYRPLSALPTPEKLVRTRFPNASRLRLQAFGAD
jgi:hypothetical protein